MNKPELPRMECNEEDNLAGLRNAGFHNNNLAAELSCRERQLFEAIGQLAAEKLRADALHEALSELVDGIEDAGGHDENGDVFDISRACDALALGGKEQK